MKTNTKAMKQRAPIRKVRSKYNPNDMYYTSADWGTKEIDGVMFVSVIQNIGIREIPRWMRKDSLEFVK